MGPMAQEEGHPRGSGWQVLHCQRMRARLFPAALLAVLVLLGILATLQYRWTGELGEAEQARLQAAARSRAEGMARDLDGELARLHRQLGLRGDAIGDADWARRWEAWRREARWPALAEDVYRLRPGEAGLQAARWEEGAFQDVAWPARLAPLRDRLTDTVSGPPFGPAGPGRARRPPPGPVVAQVPAVVILGGPEERPRPGDPPGPPRLDAVVVVVLSEDVLREEVLPALAERHFGAADGGEHDLEVVAGRETERLVWRSRPGARLPRVDVTASLLEMRPEGRGGFGPGGPRGPGGEPGGWMLRVANRAGPLEEVVAAGRRRNLAVGFGILLLLASTFALVVVSAHRAQRLAEREVQFVAAVSHELRTPVSVIQGAAENLADGVVKGSDQVAAYGVLIRDESRRLARLVEVVLQYAGAARHVPRRDLVSLADVVRDAVDALRPALRAAAFEVEVDVAADTPAVQGDKDMLRHVVQNLLDNALKYDGQGRGARLTARADRASGGAVLRVEDHGPGISASDLPHVFAPFYRGREAVGGQVRGFGLGLALVKRAVEDHGGTIDVSSTEGRGTAFTIRLPAAPAAPGAEAHAVAHPSR